MVFALIEKIIQIIKLFRWKHSLFIRGYSLKAYVKGADKLLLKLTEIKDIQNSTLLGIMKENSQIVEDSAKLLVSTNTGGLKNSIFSKIEDKGKEINAIIETNSDHAMYVEFGTGPKGQENHEGISPNITPVYTSHGWIIPVTAISTSDAERYHMIPYIVQGTVFGYFTQGQAAKPFMYPALKNNEKIIIKRTKERVNNAIKDIANDK